MGILQFRFFRHGDVIALEEKLHDHQSPFRQPQTMTVVVAAATIIGKHHPQDMVIVHGGDFVRQFTGTIDKLRADIGDYASMDPAHVVSLSVSWIKTPLVKA